MSLSAIWAMAIAIILILVCMQIVFAIQDSQWAANRRHRKSKK